jgi:osmotically-inducible protein OsmY
MFKICVSLLMAFVLAAACFAAAKQVSDDELYNQVKMKLAEDDIVKGGALDVDVKNGVVTLGGSVEEDRQKTRAEKLVKKVKGVKQVVDHLTVKRDQGK